MKSFLTVAQLPLLSKLLRFMKVTSFFLLAFALQVSARGNSQEKLTLKFKKTEIAGILSYIEKETNYRFLYNQQLTGVRQKISLDVEDVGIKEALDQVFEGTSLMYKFMENKLIVIKTDEEKLSRLQKPVSGRITDENGVPLVGVSVNIKGTSKGTTTDTKGEFTINAEENETLVFSYVGYEQQEFKVGGGNNVSLSLVSIKKDLETVVVVGYGSVKKRDLTGSVISIKADEIKKVPAANLLESLQGKLPGADIMRNNGSASSGVSVVIRGNRSITASNGPLFIVDGIQYSSIQDINPNDIQSMEVLKDASATAIYGSRGANGVILVTTKKGTTGKPRISANSYYGVSSNTGFPDFMNSIEYRNLRREANRRITLAGINPTGTWLSDSNDGLLFNGAELTNINNGVYTDYLDRLFTNGNQQEHQVGVTAGSDKTKVYLSLGYYNEEGIFNLDNLDRYTARLNIDQTLGKIAKTGMQFQFTYYDANTRFNPIDEASKVSPFSEPFDANGNIILSPMNEAARWNPLIDDQPNIKTVNNSVTSRSLGVAYFELTPFKGFTARSHLGLVIDNSRVGTFNESNSLARRGQGSFANYTDNTGRNLTWENIFTYNKTWSEHSIALTGVTSFLQNNSEFVSAEGRNQILSSQLFYGLGNAVDGIVIASGYIKSNLVSYTGRLNYSFRGKYLFSGTIRTDGSSKLGPGNKWDYFPSAAVAWRISDETFLASSKTFNELKLRVSYGTTGSDAIDAYQTQSGLIRIPNSFGDNAALGFTFSDRLGNPDLKWEKTKVFNTGLDFGLIDNRITGSIDYYNTKTTDLLLDRLLPPTSGVSRVTQNIGSTSNTGIDVSVNVAVIRKKDMTFNAGVTFYTNKERITALVNGSNDLANGWFIGYPVRVLFDYRKIGIWQLADSAAALLNNQRPGDIRVSDENGDKVITSADRTVVGQLAPKWNGGLNLDFRFKGFDFNAYVFARMGQSIDYNYYTRVHLAGRENGARVNYWTLENPSNDFPRPRSSVAGVTNLAYGSTLGYIDGSFIKLRNISLGYTLPQSLVSKLKLSNVRVYITGKNLWTIHSHVKDYDVERGGGLTTPFTKLVVGGINVDL
jgi:TonB-linked SusC/RagA family outer membrane protein